MRAVGVQHLEQPDDEVLAVLRPFVAVDGQETFGREHRASVFRVGTKRRRSMIDGKGERFEEAFEKGPQLGIGGRPVAAGMRLDRLIEMSGRHMKAELTKQTAWTCNGFAPVT